MRSAQIRKFGPGVIFFASSSLVREGLKWGPPEIGPQLQCLLPNAVEGDIFHKQLVRTDAAGLRAG